MPLQPSSSGWKKCCLGYLIYLDDIISPWSAVSRGYSEAPYHITAVTQRRPQIKPEEMHSPPATVPFLGHMVSDQGVSTDPKKIEAVWTWFFPQTAKDVKSFLGLSSYYIARPLYRLTEGQREFRWTRECEDEVCQLKSLLTTASILTFPTLDSLFILDTDAKQHWPRHSTIPSPRGGGGGGGGGEKVIAFHSKSLSKSERNYCVTRKQGAHGSYCGSKDLPPLLVWKAVPRPHRSSCFEMIAEVQKPRGPTR